MSKLDHGDSLRPKEQKQRDDPQPDCHAAVSRDRRNDVEVEDSHNKQQHEVAAPKSPDQVWLFDGL
jgi:hypothetical protein